MATLDVRDVFSDRSMLVDPYSYFDEVRAVCPVHRVKDRNIMLVTGYEECREVLMDEDLYSAVISSVGPALPLPFEPHGDDITEQLDANRHKIPLHDMVTSMDGEAHRAGRSLLNKLFVPSRLKANEAYMVDLAGRMADAVIAKGGCDMIAEIATPFATLVIADLLGVPSEDRAKFQEALAVTPTMYDVDNPESDAVGKNGYMDLAGYFFGYIEDRRANPRDDLLTQLSHATFPDGTAPDTTQLVTMFMTLFGAGQDTSAKLLANSTRVLCEDQALQAALRSDHRLIPAFLEEMMRMEGSVKMTSRIATRRTTLGGVDVPAGQVVAVVVSAANRDPRRFDDPLEFRLGRPKAAEHLGFGRGSHVCIGAPLARAEVRVFLHRMLEKTSRVSISEEHHGPAGVRTFRYEPSYGLRGLADLHVRFQPA